MGLKQQIERLQAQRLQRPFLLKGHGIELAFRSAVDEANDLGAAVSRWRNVAPRPHRCRPAGEWQGGSRLARSRGDGNCSDRSRGRIDPLVAAGQAVGLASRAPAPVSYNFTGIMLTA